jgi:hypothetical protein
MSTSERINTDTRMMIIMAPRKASKKQKVSKRPSKKTSPARSNLLELVLYSAHRTLLERDGRCSGIKFNKLVYSIYNKFKSADNPDLHFQLPYRWYLYGAVVDFGELHGVVISDHPEDELRSNVTYTKSTPWYDGPARSEVQRECDEFCDTYPGDLKYKEMLRAHYGAAKLPFQKSFLEWNFLISDMAQGHEPISAPALLGRLNVLARTFPKDIAPGLAAPFSRLCLALEGVLRRPMPPHLDEIVLIKGMVWDFWSTFCLFLSQHFNENISQPRLGAYKERADLELVAYKRRLMAALETVYLDPRNLREPDRESIRALSSILVARVEEYFED